MNLASILVGISSGAMTLLGGGDLAAQTGAVAELGSVLQAEEAPQVLSVSGGIIMEDAAEETVPLARAEERTPLLTFGLHVTPDPATNPIDPPERFTGFHTALDFEILEGEEDASVPVSAIADGEILFSGYVEGYGGVIVQNAVIGGQETTVLYGHLLLSSLAAEGAQLRKGDELAELAPAYSRDSGYTRKHLHMGIHKGAGIEFLGYVQTAGELDAFIDPMTVLQGA